MNQEEKRVIAEMEEGLKETQNATAAENVEKEEPETRCKRCGGVMENGVCRGCGFRVYVPLDDKKIRKIRMIVGGVCIAIFLLIVFIKNL